MATNAVLVPVPLHPRKFRERGYNQSQLIAEHLARAAGGKADVRSLLRRTVDTDSQTHHDRKERQANLKNAFALASPAGLSASQHYVLVDDVFTTGSTLNSCARALRGVGVLNLDVVTFGHG
jgi:ComF family protein